MCIGSGRLNLTHFVIISLNRSCAGCIGLPSKGRPMSCKPEKPDLFQSTSFSDSQAEQSPASKTSTTAQTKARKAKPATAKVGRASHSDRPSCPSHGVPWDPHEIRYLTDKMVAARYDVSRATIWRWTKDNPDFPAPLSLGSGSSRWALPDLVAYEASRRKIQTGGTAK